MSFIRVALLALLCQKGTHSKAINSFAGPYTLYTERFYMCELNRSFPAWGWHFRTTRFNPYKPREIQLLTGNLTVSQPMDDSSWGKIVMDVWAHDQWKENSFVFEFKNKGCTNLKQNIPSFYEHAFKKRETKASCIIRPGVYELNDAPVKWEYPNLPIMPYGRYRLKMKAGNTDPYCCFMVDVRVIPKVD
ncbi:uncharacterized protein LOC127750993 [Frankliniella occidentalis]|uniref:Uncharacterized protein LOC127750993 n=1 Tax=Frankliniella occidentalis TaxID=133901 RepID=A0A9C6XSW3_FRAOC|nr:uncharacterized protein LOC127750993 [Frankliniella occidentalis]